MSRGAAGRQPWAFFVDTSAFFALGARDDARHGQATAVLGRAVQDRARLVTTSFVIAETHALYVARLGRDAAAVFLRDTDNNAAIAVVRPTEADELAARAIIYRFRDKAFSLTDAISFAVMERLHLERPFSFDRDFEQYGFAGAGQ